MPQSSTDCPSVNTVGNTNGLISSVKFSQVIFFWRASPSVIPSVVGRCLVFFITDKIGDGMENY